MIKKGPAVLKHAVISLSLALLAALSVSAADCFVPLDLRDVQVGGEIGRRIDITLTNNLLKLDVDRDFLPPFRKKDGKEVYIGLGKLLDTAVKLAAYSRDPRALALKQHLVEETLKCQEADGYVGIFPASQRIKTLWDVHEMGYVIWGLLCDYRYFGDKQSLAAAEKAADYLVKNWTVLPKGWGDGEDVAPHVAFTGIERTMLAMNRETGNPAYLDFCLKTRALQEWDLGIMVGRRKGIEGHVYAFMSRCLAQLELNGMSPAPRLTRQTERAFDFMTRHDGMLITGSAGQCEIWADDQDGRGTAGETCALAYQLRVYDNLLCAKGDAQMGDLMERTLFNALFASQSPDGRRLRYFAPLEGDRAYWNTDTYCCPCNYRRIIAELPMMVFYRAQDGLAVNLYTPAQAKLTVGEGVPLVLRQETGFPNSGTVRLALEPGTAVTFPLKLRIPAWASGARVTVNGVAVRGEPKPGTFFELRREWRSGDQVVLELPMSWRLVKGRQRQAGRVAVMRGPQVFCLNPAQNPALAKTDGVDLGYLTLNPSAFVEPIADRSVRPDGIGCRIQAWKPGFGLSQKADYDLTLTEFPDADGKATYFRLRDFSCAVDDELLSGPK
jgi:DUF1680 family protein